MVEGAEACIEAKLCPGPMIGAGPGGTVAVMVLLGDAVATLRAVELAEPVGRELGPKGGCSIALPAGG